MNKLVFINRLNKNVQIESHAISPKKSSQKHSKQIHKLQKQHLMLTILHHYIKLYLNTGDVGTNSMTVDDAFNLYYSITAYALLNTILKTLSSDACFYFFINIA